MILVYEVREVKAGRLMDKLYLGALGMVRTTGWSSAYLSPAFYINPPADGIWNFHFFADPPQGPVLNVLSPVTAAYQITAPSWLQGVRVHSDTNHIENQLDEMNSDLTTSAAGDLLFKRAGGRSVVQRVLAVYDDSHQPVGMCSLISVKMKKLRHELMLTIEGPDEDRARHCIDRALTAGLLAALVAAFASGGWATAQAFTGAAMAALVECLGDGFQVRFDDRSHWIEWCT